MELLILDNDFKELGRIDSFSSLQWCRRYYDIGNFELHCSLDYFDLLDNGVYLFRNGCELAIIESIKYSLDANGKRELTISGRFVECLLDQRIVKNETNFSGVHEYIAREMVKKNCIDEAARKIPNLILGEFQGLGEQIEIQRKGEKIAEANYKSLEEIECSQRVRYDYLSDQLIYEVWKGLDRTDEQSINDWAVFSDNNETISDFDYEKDKTDYCNFCYVYGDGEGSAQVIVEVNQIQPGEARRECMLKSSTSRKNDDDTTMSDAEYREKLKQEGLEELKENKGVEVFDGSLDITKLIYKEDYDLGDLCTCYIQEIGKMANKRITEITEVYEDSQVKITPKFGDDYELITKMIKRK